MPLTVVIAPDSFKGSLSAQAVANAIAAGWTDVRPGDALKLLPQADGGEGTIDAISAAIPGAIRQDAGQAHGPDGRPVRGEWLELPGGVGVAELAQTSGLPLMTKPDPLRASSTGLGEVIRAALNSGIRSLVVGLGGSASTDGGAGALTALGLRLLNDDGIPVQPGGGGLLQLAQIDAAGLTPPPAGGVTLLADVTAPLTGLTGAAHVFGPQKGATPDEVSLLDAALARFASLFGGSPLAPGAGAAGGVGYGFATAWGAAIQSGSRYLAKLTGLAAAAAHADVLITGEGRFDATSIHGKVVGEAIRLANTSKAQLGIIAGQFADQPRPGSGTLIWRAALTDIAGSVESAIAAPEAALREAGRAAAHHFGECSSRKA